MGEDRLGLAIGVISRGTVPIKWMMHMQMLQRNLPVGLYWKYVIVEGMDYADGRNEVVKKAREENFEWLLFVDDDTFLPHDAIKRLLSHQKDISTGIYWTKSNPTEPVIFERFGAGPMYKFPVDKVFEVAGGGAGCLLVHMEVFDKFDEAGIPYFKQGWSEDGVICTIGEDHWFYKKARELGYKVYADSGVLCDHYCINTKTFFPPKEVVRDITGEKLKEEGIELPPLEESDKDE